MRYPSTFVLVLAMSTAWALPQDYVATRQVNTAKLRRMNGDGLSVSSFVDTTVSDSTQTVRVMGGETALQPTATATVVLNPRKNDLNQGDDHDKGRDKGGRGKPATSSSSSKVTPSPIHRHR